MSATETAATTKHARWFRFTSEGEEDLKNGIVLFFEGRVHSLSYLITTGGILIGLHHDELQASASGDIRVSAEGVGLLDLVNSIQRWLYKLTPEQRRQLCPSRPRVGFKGRGTLDGFHLEGGPDGILYVEPGLI